MHVGAVVIFEGPPPAPEQFREHLAGRLHLVPRYRQKLVFPKLQMGRPLWIDDPSFNIDYHVRHTALPKPGSIENLRALAGRIFSQCLHCTKPLWDICMVEGLDDGRFAPIPTRPTTPMVHGVSGAHITTVLFDLYRERHRDRRPGRGVDARAPSPPDGRGGDPGARELAEGPLQPHPAALGAATQPAKTAAELREVAEGACAGAGGDGLSKLRLPPLNTTIGTHRQSSPGGRRPGGAEGDQGLAGGTVNDVFLAIVSGVLARWLRTRGTDTKGLELRGAVPVSVRTEAQKEDARQQDHDHDRSPPHLPRRSGRPPAQGERADEAPEGVEAGRRRRGHRPRRGLRPAQHPRPLLAPPLLQPALQPPRHQRPRAPVPAVPARPPAH